MAISALRRRQIEDAKRSLALRTQKLSGQRTQAERAITPVLGANAGTGVLPDGSSQDPSGTAIAQPRQAQTALQEASQPGAFTLPPRQDPTVATPEQPLVSIGGTDTGDFAGLTDREKQTQILLKQSKGESLTDEESKFRINQFLDKQEVTPESLGFTEATNALQQQVAGLETEMGIARRERDTEREKLLQQKKREVEARFAEKTNALRDAGGRIKEASGTALSFSGFGRSTFSADQQAQIQTSVNNQIEAARLAKDLEFNLFQKQLRGADEESLQADKDRINGIKDKIRQFELDSVLKVAELNQKNALNFEKSFSNLLKTLSPGSHKKMDKNASKLLGYASDEFGNPLFTDEQGEPVPLPKKDDATKWGSYKDRFGSTVFFDKSNPTNQRRGNKPQTFTNEDGSTSSSPTSDSSNIEILGEGDTYTRDDDTQGKLGENCVKYARTIVPNLPFGLVSKEDKVKAIEFAQNEGFGSTDTSLAQVGDAILTREGSWGHAAVVSGIDPQTGDLILNEANYKSGQVTEGRRISANDPLIIGMISSSAQPQMSSVINQQGKGEGNNAGVDTQVVFEASEIPETKFSNTQVLDFQKYEKEQGDYTPSSVGSEQELTQFRNNYEVWKKQGGDQDEGQLALEINVREKNQIALETIDEILNGGLIKGAGRSSLLGKLSLKTQDLQSAIDTVVSNIALEEMKRLKDASPTGSTGFGALSEKELNILTGGKGSLRVSMSEDRLEKVLKRLKKSLLITNGLLSETDQQDQFAEQRSQLFEGEVLVQGDDGQVYAVSKNEVLPTDKIL